ncbi:MAG: DUF4276 family protein [Bryobacteraceae bacterium]
MTVKVYVEGGGDHNKALETQCRRGFPEFFKKAGLEGRMPRVVRCGGRQQAYEKFRTSHENAGGIDFPILLVDSEAPVDGSSSWEHVRLRPGDQWSRPQEASDDQIHLMVQAMEAWFHADKDALQEYFGRGFRVAALSQRPDIESIAKADLFAGLLRATKDCPTGEYSKGEHSFQILARIDPARVRAASPFADKLLSVLGRTCTL